jgi:mannosidase alpha-like ER degradation enhancer 1
MRSSLNLVGSTLVVLSGKWIEYSSGIGAGTTPYASNMIYRPCSCVMCPCVS